MNYNRENYLEAVKNKVEKNIFFHSLALEACLGGIYDHLKGQGRINENEAPREDWLLAGLIHDVDYFGDYKETHPKNTKEVLDFSGLDLSDGVDSIVKAHAPERTGIKPQSLAQWAIFCADSLTGLIVATALVYPSKKLADVKSASVIKRFLKEPKFAAGTRRDQVAMCANPDGLNTPLEKFIEICLLSMQKIVTEIGL
ncbi:MAG: phosphohydrolase [Candidatus Nealsonbacteria bacterium]|nr:phosphohydrolase [Candidatus Nealsonbacteria bacterium]